MTTLDTLRPQHALDTRAHHDAWSGLNAKPRAAAACRDYDASTLQSLVTAYMHERDQPSPHTISAYRAGVARYVEWSQRTGVSILRPDRNAGTRYRADLQDAYSSPGSVNTRLVGAQSMYRALSWADVDHVNPFQHVRGVKDKRAPERVRDRYSDAELHALLNAAQDATDRCIVLLGAHAGLRLAEMRGLVWEGIQLPERDATGAWLAAGWADVHGKGGTDVQVPLGDALMHALVSLPGPHTGCVLKGRTPGAPMSASGVRHRLALMATRAGIVDDPRGPRPRKHDGSIMALGVHRLRHSFGTRVAATHGLDVAQTALRHASPTTTARYVKGRDQRVASFVRTLAVP